MFERDYTNRKYRTRTSSCICFELPDMVHIVSIYIYTYTVHCRVLEDQSCHEVIRFDIDKRKSPNWEDLMEAFQEKAVKHFPRPVRHKTGTDERIRRGL